MDPDIALVFADLQEELDEKVMLEDGLTEGINALIEDVNKLRSPGIDSWQYRNHQVTATVGCLPTLAELYTLLLDTVLAAPFFPVKKTLEDLTSLKAALFPNEP
jgi:hypothetical protein